MSAVIEEEGILAVLGTKMDRLSTNSLRVGTDNIILWCEEHTLKRWISNSRREDDSWRAGRTSRIDRPTIVQPFVE